MDVKNLQIAGILSLFLFSIFAGCAGAPLENPEKLRVAVSILPQKEFVEQIGGDRALVTLLVPPGAEPHTYEPTPRQLEEISGADIYVIVGSGIEFESLWLGRIKSVNPSLKIVNSSQGITLMPMEFADEDGDAAGNPDPHVWLSLKNAQIMVENTCLAMAQADPQNAQYYLSNAQEYLGKLRQTDSEISSSISQMQNKMFIVFHPAWGYFARDYGLTQVPIEKEGKEPTAKGMLSIIQTAEENGIKAIFASPEYSVQSAESIAGQIGGKVVLITPLPENYLENAKKAASAFTASSQPI